LLLRSLRHPNVSSSYYVRLLEIKVLPKECRIFGPS
jgi:hypothetical protein